MLKKLYSKKYPAWQAFLVNTLLVVTVVLMNNAGQHFCIPVLWFGIYLITTAVGFCVYPLLQKFPVFQKIALLLSTLWVWVYIFGLIFSVVGMWADKMLGLSPFYLIYMFSIPLLMLLIIARRLKKHFTTLKIPFISLHFTISILLGFCMVKYQRVSSKIEAANTNIQQLKNIRDNNPIDAWMLERITGMHFIYHTRLCLYDGWRPPLLDPILSLGYILNGDPLYDCERKGEPHAFAHHKRVLLYKQLFPNKPVVQQCSCPGAPMNYFMNLEEYK